MAYDKYSDMMMNSASNSPGQSGGGVFAVIDGALQLVGIETLALLSAETSTKTFPHYTKERANEFTRIYDVVNRSDIKKMLEVDRAAVGNINPYRGCRSFLQSDNGC